MARGDSIYAKVDVDILDGEKVSQLTPNERDTYLFGYWLPAVKYHQNRVENHLVCVRMLQKRLQKSKRTVQQHRQKLHLLGLITIHEDNSVTVHGVKERHSKLNWNEYKETAPYGEDDFPHTGPIRGILRHHEIKTVRQEEVTSPSLVPSLKSESSDTAVWYLKDADEMWRRSEAMSRKLYSTDEARTEAAKKFYNAFKNYPEVWINEAYAMTCDKLDAIKTKADGWTPFQTGPGRYMLGILKKRALEAK